MPCHLVNLPTELQLKIINELRKDVNAEGIEDDYDEERRGKSDEKQESKESQSMHCRILDLMNWSCTASYYRDLLAPYIFESVKIRNTEASGRSVMALSKSSHSKHVKKLLYVGWTSGEAEDSDSEEGCLDTSSFLSEDTSSILSKLSCFPSLEALSIQFPYSYSDYTDWDEELDLTNSEEPDDVVRSKEDGAAWRALMAKSWNALIQNQEPKFRSLEIRQLRPIRVSTFNDPAFHDFLGQFERFELSIYGADNGAGWNINKNEIYETFMPKLDEYFFNHLISVTDLVFKASANGPLGLEEGNSHIRLALNRNHMPALQKVYLEYILVGPELIDFVIGHKETLKSLTMRRCSADMYGGTNDIPWKTFFDSLRNAKPQKLRHLELLFDKVPLTREDNFDLEEDEAKVPAEVKQVRQILANDTSRRIFPYTYLDDKYGFIAGVDDENLAAFQRGDDQASYDRLMELINANARNQAG